MYVLRMMEAYSNINRLTGLVYSHELPAIDAICSRRQSQVYIISSCNRGVPRWCTRSLVRLQARQDYIRFLQLTISRGGAGPEACAAMINQDFERVFYKQNYGLHTTFMNLYMVWRTSYNVKSQHSLTPDIRRNKLGEHWSSRRIYILRCWSSNQRRSNSDSREVLGIETPGKLSSRLASIFDSKSNARIHWQIHRCYRPFDHAAP